MDGAATSTPVYLTVYGVKGTTPPLPLGDDSLSSDYFLRGKESEFRVCDLFCTFCCFYRNLFLKKFCKIKRIKYYIYLSNTNRNAVQDQVCKLFYIKEADTFLFLYILVTWLIFNFLMMMVMATMPICCVSK